MGNMLIDFPMKLLMPSSFENIKEIAFKTMHAASKIEIKEVLEQLYGLEIEKVRTLNKQGMKKRRECCLVTGPNYKKAYRTLKKPVSFAFDMPFSEPMGS
ncbi:hypothetical protein AB3S75_040242 [Citrus x aurantiifolia]